MLQQKLRTAVCAFALLTTAWLCLAAPPLTTIQDVLYKADGTRFNGLAVIEWKGFEAADASVVPTQFVTVQIRNGNLRVQLVPTTNASSGAYYTVRYNSDGKVQFSETWVVRPSPSALRLRDVRVPGGSGVVLPPGGVTQAAGPGFADSEIPTGAVDGANRSFTLANDPVPGSSLALYRNGVLQKQGLDYTLSGAAIGFVPAATPQDGDVLLASYRLADASNPSGSAGGALAGTYPNPVLADAVVYNANIAAAAGIAETKLALNYPTHSNVADPQVICSSQGSSSGAAVFTELASCVIPISALQSGARIEVRFDYSHEGSSAGFAAQVSWGASTILSDNLGQTDPMLSGRIDAVIVPSGAQWTAQAWGNGTGLAPVAGIASGPVSAPITVRLYGRMNAASSDTITVRNLTVIAYPLR